MREAYKLTQVTLDMTEEDFENLSHTSMGWGKAWKKQRGRFIPEPSYDYAYAYWFGSYVEMMIARQYLLANMYLCQRVVDEADGTLVLLTDYKSLVWQIEG